MSSMIFLRVYRSGKLEGVRQFTSSQIYVGSAEESHLRLEGDGVSEFHCMLEKRTDGYFLTDLGSKDGTRLQGTPVVESIVSSGQKISVGHYELVFFVGPGAEVSKTVPAPPAAVAPAAPVKVAPVVTVAPPAPEAPPVPKAPPVKEVPPVRAAPRVVEAPPVAAGLPPKPPEVRAGLSLPVVKSTRKKSGPTFAPPSAIKNLSEYLRPSKGPVLEVVVAWKERVLDCFHYAGKKTVTLGSSPGSNIQVPSSLVPTQIGFVELGAQTKVFVPSFGNVDLIQTGKNFSQEEILNQGRGQRLNDGISVPLVNGEIVHVSFGEAGWEFWVRYIPAPPILSRSSTGLSAGEWSAILGSILGALFLGVASSLYEGAEVKDIIPEPERQAQFVYTKKVEISQQGDPKEEIGKQAPVKVEAKQEQKQAPSEQKVTQDQNMDKAARAAELRAKQSANRSKQFGSVKQGGAVKMADKEAANAQSKTDITKTGIMGAFSGSGVRSQLDRAYSGSGQLLGMADKATGASGMADSRAGTDLGSKFKEGGAGGKGTATEGIAGVGTKGRSSGQGQYGELGSGGKGSVSIVSEGEGAGFTGGLDKAGIRRTIQSIIGQIRSCYEKGLRAESSLEGRLVIQFEIDDRGAVNASKVESSTLNDSEVGNCVANRIRSQRFPPSPRGVVGVVDYPFVFGAQK